MRASRSAVFGQGARGGMPRDRPKIGRASLMRAHLPSKQLSHYPEFCLHNGKEGLATTVWRLRPVEPLRVSGAVSTGGRELITRAAIDRLAARPESLQPVDSICLSE